MIIPYQQKILRCISLYPLVVTHATCDLWQLQWRIQTSLDSGLSLSAIPKENNRNLDDQANICIKVNE